MLKICRKLLIATGLLAVCANAYALVTIEIDEGVERGVPIAVVPFGVDEGIELEHILDDVIRNDLARTGRFDPIPPIKFLSFPTTFEQITFNDWRLIKVDYVVIGSVSSMGDGSYKVISRLFDAYEQKQIFGNQYIAKASQLRNIAHQIANNVYESVTGSKSSFHSKIAFTSTVQSSQGKPEHRLYVADYDGYNAQILLKTNDPILSPTWSPDSKQIAYSILEAHQTKIYIQTVATGNRRVVAEFEGQNRSPSWSPDGRKIAFANSIKGNSDVFILTLEDGTVTRLTNHREIDTEPAWSPDGKYIVFTSNRGKNAQIYRIRARENAEAKRITLEGESNSGARYSPSGKQLILISNQGNGNQVAIYDFKAQSIKIVSSTSIDDSAIFSSNGDMLMYIVEGGDRHISILSPNGKIQSRIEVAAGSVKQVAWESKN